MLGEKLGSGDDSALGAAFSRGGVVEHGPVVPVDVGIRRELGEVEEYVLHGKDPAQVPTVLNAMDLVLLTSQFEASPTVVKEAILCNVPVVSTDVGDARESVRGVSHTLVTERSADALATAAISILRDLPRSDGSSKRDELGIDRTVTRMISFYEETMELEGRSAG